MIHASRLRPLLKRGALVTAANWPLVIVHFAADSTFKLVLAVPVIGAAFLVGASAGGDLSGVLGGDLRQAVSTTLDALNTAPLALIAFVLAFGLVIVGGSALMWLIKGGSVTILALAERSVGPIERPPLRLAAVARANRFGIDRFLEGCGHLWRRYLALGFALLVVYAASGSLYLLLLVGAFRGSDNPAIMLGWTFVMVLATGLFFVWITLVNLAYLLMQMVIAVDDCGLKAAVRRVTLFVKRTPREVAGIFGVVFVLVILSTAASILTAGGLGLIAFVPFVGVLVFPLQIAAWALRGILFQYLGLTALGAYLTQYRSFLRDQGIESGFPAGAADFDTSSWGRTA